MSSINFNNLKNVSRNVEDYTYVDLQLDLQENSVGYSRNFLVPQGTGRDIKVARDMNAVKNSLKNLFNTVPGERFLQPEYGEDLRQFLFEQMSEGSGHLIGSAVRYAIEKWEPRIVIRNISVDVYIDQQEYDITLSLYVPSLKQTVNIAGVFTREGFVIRG